MREVGPIRLDGRTLTPAQLAQVAAGAPVQLDENARRRMVTSAAWYAREGRPDVLTAKWGFLVSGDAQPDEVVRAFVLGHCAGVGDPLPPDVVRATMAARVNVLATGTTGCRPCCADALITMLDRDWIPVVPSQGSVGAAGDLAPLAHILRVVCGWGGEVWRDGVRVKASTLGDLPELRPTEKEALSLINGATLTAAMAALAVHRSERLLSTAVVSAALAFDVVRADLHCLSAAALEARRHPGGVQVAERMRAELAGSELCAEGRRPDPFSIRCTPAVLGTAFETLDFVTTVVTRELNGACDNPLVLSGAGVVEAGNFHGAPVAAAMDTLKIGLTQAASIAERRIFRMTYGQLSGLPSFLLPNTGLNSGLMLAQYTAASLVSECKVMSHPASVDSLPTVQHHEDHVSMGPIAARGALHIVEALADVLAIELICGAQGLDFHLSGEAVNDAGEPVSVRPKAAGQGCAAAHATVRSRVTRRVDDRVLHPDLVAVGELVRSGAFTSAPGPW